MLLDTWGEYRNVLNVITDRYASSMNSGALQRFRTAGLVIR